MCLTARKIPHQALFEHSSHTLHQIKTTDQIGNHRNQTVLSHIVYHISYLYSIACADEKRKSGDSSPLRLLFYVQGNPVSLHIHFFDDHLHAIADF